MSNHCRFPRLSAGAGLVAGLAAFLSIQSVSMAGTLVVNNFGVGGWYSWDTRSSSGAQLVGTNNTSPAFPGIHTSADDATIAKQIIFMGQGQTINTADGNAPPGPSPTGSLNGLGYVRLDGTNNNSGKSDLSYVNSAGIAAPSALLASSFSLSYRYFIEPNPTFRTLGLNISLTGTDGKNYTFSHIQPGAVNGFNTENADNSTSLFDLFVNGVGVPGSHTLADWATDPTYGSPMFGAGASIYRIGFNLGSFQRQDEQYLDWMQTNLLNGGDLIDFQGPATPLPPAAAMGLTLISSFGAGGLIRKRLTGK